MCMINMYMNMDMDGSYVSENMILKKFSLSSKGFQCLQEGALEDEEDWKTWRCCFDQPVGSFETSEVV